MSLVHSVDVFNTDISKDIKTEENYLCLDDESDSGSDVIYVERNEDEVIELSDDENISAEYFKSLNLPDDLIHRLKRSSNSISMKLGEYIRNKTEVKSIITEIPNRTWSLPWEAVSRLFNHTNNIVPVKNKRSKNNNSSKFKRKLPSSIDFSEDSKVEIKKEKMSEDSDFGRNIPLVQFDVNKPPEFCEVSRSGRVIKKPTRLKDNLTFFRRTNQLKKKRFYTDKRKINIEETTNDDYKNDLYINNTNLSVIDNDSLDRFSDDSEIQYPNNLYNYGQSSSDNQSNQLISDESNSQNSFSNRQDHNLKEKERRSEIQSLFKALHNEIDYFKPEIEQGINYSYMRILTEAYQTIKQLECSLNGLRKTAESCRELNKLLELNLETCRAKIGL